jgi:hypothetical protein
VTTKSRSPSPNLGFPRLNKAHLKGLTQEGEDTNVGASSPWSMLNPYLTFDRNNPNPKNGLTLTNVWCKSHA